MPDPTPDSERNLTSDDSATRQANDDSRRSMANEESETSATNDGPKKSLTNDGSRKIPTGDDPRKILTNDSWCFVCGPENPIGLKVSWTLDADGCARGTFRPGRQHQGWKGIVHGGILASLCDEAMAQRLRLAGTNAVTAGLSVRYRKSAPIERPLYIEARLLEGGSRVLRLEASVRGEDGTCYARAEGTCIPITL